MDIVKTMYCCGCVSAKIFDEEIELEGIFIPCSDEHQIDTPYEGVRERIGLEEYEELQQAAEENEWASSW